MGGSAWVPPAATKNKEEAWELMQHLIGPEVEQAQIKHVGIMPARRAVLEEYASQEPPKHMKLVLRAAESAILIPQTPWYPEAETAALALLNELWLTIDPTFSSTALRSLSRSKVLGSQFASW